MSNEHVRIYKINIIHLMKIKLSIFCLKQNFFEIMHKIVRVTAEVYSSIMAGDKEIPK